MKDIILGRVYKWFPNGSGGDPEVVRVIKRGGGEWLTVVGPTKFDIPYNYAHPSELRRPSRMQIQEFIQRMPIGRR